MSNLGRAFVGVFGAVAIGIVALFLGLMLGADPGTRDLLESRLPAELSGTLFAEEEGVFPLQQEVLRRLDQSYYQELEADTLEVGAVRGMLGRLEDGYTGYLDPEQYELMMEHTEGSYSGVGMVVEMKGRFVTVISTFEGAPAQESGVRPGDLILGVDDTSTQGLSLTEVVNLIKGEEGTDVVLQTYRAPAGQELDLQEIDGDRGRLPPNGTTEEITVTRKVIDIPVVETEMLEAATGKVAYIRLLGFSEGAADLLRSEVEEAVEEDGVEAVIIGLRNNGGGLLTEAVKVAGIFIEDGTVVTTEGLHSPKRTYEAVGDAYEDIPLYVVVNEYSASASEIVAGAVKDTGRGVLVGETTFGKGLVQTIQMLSNGGALRVTTAAYVTPKGTDINHQGIDPEYEVTDDPETEDVDEPLQKVLELVEAGG